MTSSILTITDNDLSFASLGGKYRVIGFYRLALKMSEYSVIFAT